MRSAAYSAFSATDVQQLEKFIIMFLCQYAITKPKGIYIILQTKSDYFTLNILTINNSLNLTDFSKCQLHSYSQSS
ncbi:putative group XIIA secretory phospholipase A2 [Trichinella spiralis]|uniref:putative group XIIA secretory phospholipase A2 n=1 Tax=Trichinella spiralis TaxID=6334 RepID=UPI0001EFCAF8|nr:putative group XIIA secretory phospholipase A2 [Trichinella spiralis]